MQVRDLNTRRESLNGSSDDSVGATTTAAAGPAPESETAEIAFLRSRIEHLELVVETARGLMTNNQERLLRRLHELPREMAALSARVHGPARDAAWGQS